jgi:hypothetical protein
MPCQPGDRIVLVATADAHTFLIPGTIGTVTARDGRGKGQLAVAGDDGSTLSMLPRDGDQVRLITPAAPGAARENPAPPARQARPSQNLAGGSPPPASPAPLPTQP